jgi:hypothetical protein
MLAPRPIQNDAAWCRSWFGLIPSFTLAFLAAVANARFPKFWESIGVPASVL